MDLVKHFVVSSLCGALLIGLSACDKSPQDSSTVSRVESAQELPDREGKLPDQPVDPNDARSASDGFLAYQRGDYQTALRVLSPLASGGNPAAQMKLAAMYKGGQGVPQDYAKSARWYRAAAEAYRQPAEQGDAAAQYIIGGMYSDGTGLPQNYADALTWYRKAANQGHPEAQSRLGSIYQTGLGVSQDFVIAHKWFNLAAASGIASAAQSRDLLASKMTSADVAKAQKLAVDWRPGQVESESTPSPTQTPRVKTPKAVVKSDHSPAPNDPAPNFPGLQFPTVPPRIDPEAADRFQPEYPLASRQFGEQGNVLLAVLVDVDGSVDDVKLVAGSYYPRLDEAALVHARRAWKFVPATRGGTAVKVWHRVNVKFELAD